MKHWWDTCTWPCPRILRCGSISTVFAQICAQTADRLEFWVIDLPAHKRRQNDGFMKEQKVLSHVLLHLRGTKATGRRWTNASVPRWDAGSEIDDLYEKAGKDWKKGLPSSAPAFMNILLLSYGSKVIFPQTPIISQHKEETHKWKCKKTLSKSDKSPKPKEF